MRNVLYISAVRYCSTTTTQSKRNVSFMCCTLVLYVNAPTPTHKARGTLVYVLYISALKPLQTTEQQAAQGTPG